MALAGLAFVVAGCVVQFDKKATCGDGVVTGGEECDDGNRLSGDGCGPDCTVEEGWECDEAEPSHCEQLCGNARLDPGEECDGGDLGGTTCQDLGFDSGTLVCNGSCHFDTVGCRTADCGNGIVDPGEECDDGNQADDDACLSNCREARCGDGHVWSGHEECDDGNQADDDACLSNCREARCGDGHVWSGHEECDDGNQADDDACLSNCREARCGDGHVWSGHEECDDGNQADGDACLSNCREARCGDGHVWSGHEECDDGNTVSGDGCSASCRTEDLPELYWVASTATGWLHEPLLLIGPDAPPVTATIVAAAGVEKRGEAFFFTRSTYHVLDLATRQWVRHGLLSRDFPGFPAATFRAVSGDSAPNGFGQPADFTNLNVLSGISIWWYHVDDSTGQITAYQGNPVDASSQFGSPNAPEPSRLIDWWVDVGNVHGWESRSVNLACGGSDTNTSQRYMGSLTSGETYAAAELQACVSFYPEVGWTFYTPFSSTTAGRPSLSGIRAIFYASGVLYVVVAPGP